MFWKLIMISLVSLAVFQAYSDEPNSVILSTKDFHQEIDFSTMKPVILKTINHHPQFKTKGEIEYQGYKFQDILKTNPLRPQQPVMLLATTGEFSLELKAEEILGDDVILATHMNGQRIDAKEHGNQIIYGPKAIAKYPHLKERLYWIWWVRNIVIDTVYHNDYSSHPETSLTLTSEIPFPQPDGASSIGPKIPTKALTGKILNTKKSKMLKIHLVNNNILEVPVKNNFSYFLAVTPTLNTGGEVLHVLEIKNNKVINLISHIFYIKKLEVL